MFFNGDKKATLLNNETKQRVLSIVGSLIAKCAGLKDSELSSQLISIRNELNTHAPTPSKEVLVIDYKILRYLEDLQNDLDNGWTGTAGLRISHINGQLSERKKICNISGKGFQTRSSSKIGGKVDKEFDKLNKKYGSNITEKDIKIDELYSADDLLDIAINREQDKINGYSAEIEELMEKRLETPGNQALKSKLQTAKDNKKLAEECLKKYVAVRDKSSVAKFMGTATAARKEAMAISGISDDELQVMYQEYLQEMKAGQVSDKQVYDIRSKVMGGNASSSGESLFSRTGLSEQAAGGVSGEGLPAARAHKFTEDELFELKLKAQMAIKICEKQGEKYQAKIDEIYRSNQILANKIRSKIDKYDELDEDIKAGDFSASMQHNQIKGDIKRSAKELETAQRSINRYDQRLDINAKYKAIYVDSLNVIDMQLDDMAMADVAGDIFTNIESVALWLNATVKESNAEAERSTDLYNVARGEDYQADSISLDFENVFKTDAEDQDIAKIRKILGM